MSDPFAAAFRGWQEQGRVALIPYITAGYPTPAATPAILDALVRGGADIIELGVPFSDPVADGPTIQRSSQRALEHGVSLATTLAMLRQFRQSHDTPVVIFSYLNPILAFGLDRFIAEAVDAGAQGVLLTDLPVGGDAAIEAAFDASPLALIRLIAPTTSADRARHIAENARGFIYYVARLGVTGAGSELRDQLASELDALRELAAVPVAVGFGVSTAEHAAALATHADAIIVGSALIDVLDAGGVDALEALMTSLRAPLSEQGSAAVRR